MVIVGPGRAVALAAPDLSDLCEVAAAQAAEESGVPLSVLRAISLTETGRKRGGRMRPWPWTVNMEGKGKWFDDPEDARAYVYKNYKQGARSFDVGCFQINFKWHGAAFASIEEMFEPLANARYAAKFLSDLYEETGSWAEAAGAYHSRTPKYAERYKKRFEAFRAKLDGEPAAPPQAPEAQAPLQLATAPAGPPQPPLRQPNRYPLLQGRIGGNTLGSLVPLVPGSRPQRLIDVVQRDPVR